MLLRRLHKAIVGFLVLAGCAPRYVESPGPSACPYATPAGSDPFWPTTAAPVLRLVGRFDLISVNASSGGPLEVLRGELVLRTTDSLFRPVAAPDSSSLTPPWLGGTLTWATGDSTYPTGHAAVEVEYDTMYVGGRRMLDGVVVDYHIVALTPDGFWGLWIDRQTGLGHLVDSTGRWLPNPAGHFCARRK
jgi:hypothetical protein